MMVSVMVSIAKPLITGVASLSSIRFEVGQLHAGGFQRPRHRLRDTVDVLDRALDTVVRVSAAPT